MMIRRTQWIKVCTNVLKLRKKAADLILTSNIQTKMALDNLSRAARLLYSNTIFTLVQIVLQDFALLWCFTKAVTMTLSRSFSLLI